jgi:hypothetical protein
MGSTERARHGAQWDGVVYVGRARGRSAGQAQGGMRVESTAVGRPGFERCIGGAPGDAHVGIMATQAEFAQGCRPERSSHETEETEKTGADGSVVFLEQSASAYWRNILFSGISPLPTTSTKHG